MKKLLKFLLYTALAIVALVVILGLFAKKDYHIERSLEMDASPAVVYDYVRHFKNFDQWSPWAALDPKMKTTLSGTDGEVGASYAWEGNKNVGKGRQTITAMTPELISIKTEFDEPFESTSPTTIKVEPAGNKTKVTWGFDMHAAFPINGLMMFTDVDVAIGKDYEMGLENLKRVTDEIIHGKYQGFEITADPQFAERTYIGVRQVADSSMVGKVFAAGMTKIQKALKGAAPAGAPVGIYWTWDAQTDMAAAVPAADAPIPAGLSQFVVGGKTAYIVEIRGNYSQMMKGHQAMDEYLAANKLAMVPPVLEEYVTGPPTEPDTSKWLTKIIYFAQPAK